MRTLISGGAGFIGSNLTRRLVDDGHQVGVLDDFSRGRKDRLPDEVQIFQTDIRDWISVWSAVERYDVIFHLAFMQGTQTFYSKPKDVVDVGISGMMNLLRACAGDLHSARGSKKTFILVSSSEAYQIPPKVPTDETVPLSVPDITNPRYSYGGSKIACEVAAMAYAHADMFERLVIVRPHNIIGPDMGFEHVIPEFALRLIDLDKGTPDMRIRVKFPIQGSGAETRTFCHVKDCVDALCLLLEKGKDKNVYHVGHDKGEISIGDLAHLMAQEFGLSINVVPGKLPQGSPPRRLPNIDKIRALGYKPQISLQQSIPQIVKWYRDNPREVNPFEEVLR